MRPLVFALAATLAAHGLLGTADERTELRAAHPLHVVYPHATLDGVCALVDVERHATHLELYFITAARFFKNVQGETMAAAAPEVRVTMDDGTEVNVLREHRYLPIGNLIDLAVLRSDVSENGGAAASMGFTVPPPGHSFEIVGYNRAGRGRSNPSTSASRPPASSSVTGTSRISRAWARRRSMATRSSAWSASVSPVARR